MAEAESLKRQVVEARMARCRRRSEPHFLFNTAGEHRSPDPRSIRRARPDGEKPHRPAARLDARSRERREPRGRELQVVRPYLEILKVRMEDRLQSEISVDGRPYIRPTFRDDAAIAGRERDQARPGAEAPRRRAEGGRGMVHGKAGGDVADTGVGSGRAATRG